MQLELINQTLAELQTKKKPRRRIRFIQHDNNLILPSTRFYKSYNTST